MMTLTTSSSARESRKTRRMMSRALSFPWVGAGVGRQTIRAVARRRPARGRLHVRFGLPARRGTTLVKDTRADGGQGRSAHHVADPRVASERNQEEGGD